MRKRPARTEMPASVAPAIINTMAGLATAGLVFRDWLLGPTPLAEEVNGQCAMLVTVAITGVCINALPWRYRQ